MAKEVLVTSYLHMDPTWRRCFDRVAEYQGTTVQPYSVVEGLQIDAFLKVADGGHPFVQGQTAVWRKYLERHPEQLDALRRRIADGTLSVTFAGEVVQDNSMPAAEALIRNYLIAWPLYQQLAGEGHPGLKIAWQADVFGNNPNMPQILRGIGCEMTGWLSYRQLGEDTWVGIDGSMILTPSAMPAQSPGTYVKNPPCRACSGHGCDACNGSGMEMLQAYNFDATREAIRRAAATPGEFGFVCINSEEALPDARLTDLVKQMETELAPQCRVRWVTFWQYLQAYRPTMEQAAASRDRSRPSVDLNPAMPGCYVTRIRCKQRTRAVAYELLQAEAKIATAAWSSGAPALPLEEFQQAWAQVSFNQFHDAITGTHIDSAYTELMDMLDQAQAVARRYVKPKRPAGPGRLTMLDCLPASAGPARVPQGAQLPSFTRRLGSLEVTFDRLGIVSILRDGVDVFGTRPLSPTRRNIRIGELVLDQDFGDAWGQRLAPLFPVTETDMIVPMGDYNLSVEASEKAIRWKGVYRGGDPMVKRLSWVVTATASPDGRRVDFVTDVNWDTASRRLMVYVPVASRDATAQFECPFGFVDRTFDADKMNYSQWHANDMNFPVQHWVRKRIDQGRGVALLNKGLPCHRYVPGMFHISLLRSPQYHFCVVEPGTYEFWDNDGQRDAGRHRFEYSLLPHYEPLAETELTRLGYQYNMGSLLRVPFKVSGDVVVTAWKLAEDGQGWILRCFDASGRGSQLVLTFDSPRRVARTDLLERLQESALETTRYETAIHKHGIATLKVW